jgi:hypothetical protein
MSESQPDPSNSTGAPSEVPVPLAVFATSLRPRKVGTKTLFQKAGQRTGQPYVIDQFEHGSPDEIWLKLLTINHGMERNTPTQWKSLIDGYKNAPAHPSDPRYGS